MSFLKQLPPNPILALINLLPIRLSLPMHFCTSRISPPIFSQSIDMLFMEETLWARKQLATNLHSYELIVEVVMIFSFGREPCRPISKSKISFRSHPKTTRSGLRRFSTEVPSAKNYGLLTTTNLFLFYCLVWLAVIISLIILWVKIGTVDF